MTSIQLISDNQNNNVLVDQGTEESSSCREKRDVQTTKEVEHERAEKFPLVLLNLNPLSCLPSLVWKNWLTLHKSDRVKKQRVLWRWKSYTDFNEHSLLMTFIQTLHCVHSCHVEVEKKITPHTRGLQLCQVFVIMSNRLQVVVYFVLLYVCYEALCAFNTFSCLADSLSS